VDSTVDGTAPDAMAGATRLEAAADAVAVSDSARGGSVALARAVRLGGGSLDAEEGVPAGPLETVPVCDPQAQLTRAIAVTARLLRTPVRTPHTEETFGQVAPER
jgi:hypothetical protein